MDGEYKEIKKIEKTCIMIEVVIPADRNVVQKETEKKLNFVSLCIEMQRMWNLKCEIISVIVGATGIVTKGIRKNLETIPGKHIIGFSTKGSFTWNHTQYGKYCSLKLEA
jgi:hypothetical protein